MVEGYGEHHMRRAEISLETKNILQVLVMEQFGCVFDVEDPHAERWEASGAAEFFSDLFSDRCPEQYKREVDEALREIQAYKEAPDSGNITDVAAKEAHKVKAVAICQRMIQERFPQDFLERNYEN